MTLQIGRNEKFQKFEARLERIGWVLLGVFVLAGLLGLLGNGVLSDRTARTDTGALQAEYSSVLHHRADASLTLVLAPDAVVDDDLTVTVTGDWVSGVDIQSISPEPAEQLVVPDGVSFVLSVAEPGTTEITINFRAQQYGPLDMTLEVAGESVHLTQFVLP